MTLSFKNTAAVAAACISVFSAAQRPVPAPAQSQPVYITGANIHTGRGDVQSNASILFDQGKIVGINVPAPTGAKTINATGKHVYPGFILLNNTLGLIEIASTRATDDTGEANAISPEVRTVVAWNTDSHIIPTIRTNGILLAQPTMKGGIINGTSSIMNLDAWNWEDAVVAKDQVLHLTWPANRKIADEKRAKEYLDRRTENINTIKGLFARSKAYTTDGVKEYKLEAISPVFSGKKTLFVEVSGADEALEVIKFVKDAGVKNTVLVGDSSLLPVLDEIKAAGLPLVINRPHSLPAKSSDNPFLPYQFPKMVSDKGILYALDYSGDMEYQGSRNLPFIAGTTVAHGLDKEMALQSITYNAAKIAGIDNNYGSLEKGKSATLFISDGDALDELTNNVTHAFIDGREINLNNQQKELYRRYKEKYADGDKNRGNNFSPKK